MDGRGDRRRTGGTLAQLRRHRVPTWWSDAKLGIFIHWTPASVPGWAPVDSHVGELLAAGRPDALAEAPYTEWYANSLRFPHSSVSQHHREVHGSTPYDHFADVFREGLDRWDPDDWARRFRDTGARYVVLVAKHHDGFCLWPSGVRNPNRRDWTTGRDVVGELREAVLGVGLRFGLYYSGGLDWTFDDRPLGNLGDLLAAVPRGSYPAYAEAQVRELVERYRPSVLWNDIAWPGTGRTLWRLMADYYRAVPDGVLNDRWMPWNPVMATARSAAVRRLIDAANARANRGSTGLIPPKPPHFDVRTPEYTVFDHVPADPWECVRGIDQSFGYNRNSDESHFLARDELLGAVADITAKGGNLLLNVGPRGEDAAIPDPQLQRLSWLGEWMAAGGRSVRGSRPWVLPAARSPEGADLRFWARDEDVWVGVLGEGPPTLTVPGLSPGPTTTVSEAAGGPLAWEPAGEGLRVHLGGGDHQVIRVGGAAAAPDGVAWGSPP